MPALRHAELASLIFRLGTANTVTAGRALAWCVPFMLSPVNRGLLGRFGIKNPIQQGAFGFAFFSENTTDRPNQNSWEKPGRDLLRTKLGVCKGPRPTKLEERTEGCKNPSLQKDHLEFVGTMSRPGVTKSTFCSLPRRLGHRCLSGVYSSGAPQIRALPVRALSRLASESRQTAPLRQRRAHLARRKTGEVHRRLSGGEAGWTDPMCK